MGKLEALEHDIATLSSDELAQFREWFAEFDSANWDNQIAADSKAGKLDALAERARASHLAGKSTSL